MAKVWLWHDECPNGKVHDKRDEAELCRAGWVDSPAKLGQEPEAETEEEAARDPEPQEEPAEPETEAEPETAEPTEGSDLLDMYKQSAALLDDEEVLALAKQLALEVRSTMKRETLEAKINEHLAAE